MLHVFVYALPTSTAKDARIAEIAAVRTEGFGPYSKAHIQNTIHRQFAKETAKECLKDVYKAVVPDKPYAIISFQNEITKSLLRIENEANGVEDGFAGRAWVDVNQLAWPMVVMQQIPNRSIEALAAHFGVQLGRHSDSADTVTALIQIYGSMMRRYRTALSGEGLMREVGGETLEGLRRAIGF